MSVQFSPQPKTVIRKITMDPEVATKKGIVGIANVGNTCYANAAIQLLRHCPEWSSFCLQGLAEKEVADPSSNPAKVLTAYLDIIKPLWAGSHASYIQPAGFWQIMTEVLRGTIYEDFLRRIPHDAHEFLTWFLDQQYMATQKERNFTIKDANNVNDANETIAREAVKAWIDSFKKTYSPLTDLCFGLMLQKMTCHGCGNETRSWETFNMLKIKPGVADEDNSLQGMLNREMEEEKITDYACDKCKERGSVVRSHAIWRLPRNLFVVLKRFNFNGTKNPVPLNYDGGEVSFKDAFAPQSPEISKNFTYELFGSVDHHGSHMGGHYTCQAISPLSQKWWLYDDESVYPMESPKFGPSTYILGYKLRTNN